MVDKISSPRKTIQDGCPSWADAIIFKIRTLEVQLGNIREEGEGPWSTVELDRLYKRAFAGSEPEQFAANDVIETLFGQVAVGLKGEGFSSEQIAQFVNARVSSGTRLPYCNAQEVNEALA